jgi:hypothetical protein
MKFLIVLFFVSTALLLLNNCDSTEPVDELKPGRRDYTWTVDTLYSPNNEIRRTWASSENDAWAVGPGGITAYDGLWHFDGSEWQPYPQALSISPECIFGFAQNDVWMGGNEGKIFHFDGNIWNQTFSYENPSNYNFIVDIWGKTPMEIYAIAVVNDQGFKSVVLRFDGVNWVEIYYSNYPIQFFRIQKEAETLFLSGITLANNQQEIVFLKFEDNIMKEIFRKQIGEITFGSLSQIGDKTYFLIDKDLYRFINGNFVKVITFNVEQFGYGAYGRNEKDIFLSMRDGLAHYNGENVEYLYRFSNNNTNPFPYPVNLSNAVFFPAHDKNNDLNLILRGVLNK